ncbi:hypothetical protein ONZ43_g55 [Nemania bipapillata]|uniref:Uncharacterized protein n=1 Tax=Nemania bipapillata TaxID=110536 RepID=A0ACC2JA04_9PEZI|nr:hypothetical protein ONZ43_g55 [Nemania bipapillata]
MPELKNAVPSSREPLEDEKVDYAARRNSTSSHDTNSSRCNHSSSGDEDDIDDANRQERLERCSTKHSAMGDAPIQPVDSVIEIPDEFFDKLPAHRKTIILFLISFSAFLSPVSSTSVLAATPEVATEYSTTGSIVNLVNALYLLFMGLSPIFWGPLSQISLITGAGFVLTSIATALAPNLAAFFFFRLFTAFLGTSFLLNGAAVISDIYRPIERGTATGWFMSGTLIGPAFGPLIGSLIVTYRSWRVIFWLQTGLAGAATVGIYFLMPETIFHKKINDIEGYSGREKGRALVSMLNPWGVLKLFEYPSGLFYLAPGFGYLAGTFVGGRYADYIVKLYIRKRGVRIPEDRMYSALPFIGLVIPGSVIIYGWCVEKDVGGIPLTVIVLFLQGIGQLFCFPSLNTYCLDVMSGRGAEVIAGNYAMRYLFGCLATAIVLPAIQTIGVGWFSTITTFFLLGGTLCTYLSIRYGKQWRDDIDAKHKIKKLRELEKKNNRDSQAATHEPTHHIEPVNKSEL